MADESIEIEEFYNMIAGLATEMKSLFIYKIKIRSEKDPVKIAQFSAQERKIYLDWKKKHPISNEKLEIKRKLANARADAFEKALEEASKRG